MVKPWEQQEGETDNTFRMFQTYLEMPRPRTYGATAEVLGLSDAYLRRVGAANRWKERAREYDRYMQELTVERRADAIELFQGMVIREEVDDYQKLREMWTAAATELANAQDQMEPDDFLEQLRKLTHTRSVIDKMARTAAQMPNSYRAVEQKVAEEQEDGPITLTLPGLAAGGDEDDDDDD